MRTILSLNEGWQFFRKASLETLNIAERENVTLPHTWSTNEDAHRGTCWYTRELPCPAMEDNTRVWLELEGAAMTAEVYLNNKKLFRHEGGYSTFRVDLSDDLDRSNLLAISVDNGSNQAIYPQNADFTFYGGLYRNVKLIMVPAAHFALSHYGAPGIRVTPMVDLASGIAVVTVEVWVEGEIEETPKVTFSVAGQTK